MQKIYKILTMILFILLLSLTSCKNKSKIGGISMNKEIYAQIVLTTGEKINLQLFHEYAPETVENFVKLATDNYYKGTIFHRIIDNFMIQTGGYKIEDNSLLELPEINTIKGEFASNGFDTNTLKHELGVISMARTSIKDSATSQFFICSATVPHLDGEYAAFGKTTDEESNKVVLKLSGVETYAMHYMFQNFPCDIIEIENIYISNEMFK